MWPLGKLEETSRMWEEYDHIPSSVNGVCVCFPVCKHRIKAKVESHDIMCKNGPNQSLQELFLHCVLTLTPTESTTERQLLASPLC